MRTQRTYYWAAQAEGLYVGYFTLYGEPGRVLRFRTRRERDAWVREYSQSTKLEATNILVDSARRTARECGEWHKGEGYEYIYGLMSSYGF